MDKTLDLRKNKDPQIQRPVKPKDQKLESSGEVKIRKGPGPKENIRNILTRSMSWQFGNYGFNNKLAFILFLVAAFGSGGLAIFYGEFLLGIFLVLSGIVAIMYTRRSSEMINITIDSRGLYLGTEFYPYKDIKSFWIHYNPGELKEISFELKKWYMPYVKIPLAGQNPLTVRDFLLNFLIEKEQEDSLVDIVVRRF